MKPESVGSFRLRELIPLGQGGMGYTYLGCMQGAGAFERLVVIKRLHEHLSNDDLAAKRLMREAELAGCVRHANVVPVQQVGRDDQGVFLVMDYVEGGALKDLMYEVEPDKLPLGVALRVVLDCLAGLQAIHCARDHREQPLNILHRDIGPENILIGLDGVARLSDFGIAKSATSRIRTRVNQLVGKVPYMAPEYLEGQAIGPKLDVYALGVTLYELACGQSPWAGLEEPQIMLRALTDGVPPLSDSELPWNLKEIILCACSIDPDDRFGSAREMSDAILRAKDVLPIASHHEVSQVVLQLSGDALQRRRVDAAALLSSQESLDPESMTLPKLGFLDGASPHNPTREYSLGTREQLVNSCRQGTTGPEEWLDTSPGFEYPAIATAPAGRAAERSGLFGAFLRTALGLGSAAAFLGALLAVVGGKARSDVEPQEAAGESALGEVSGLPEIDLDADLELDASGAAADIAVPVPAPVQSPAADERHGVDGENPNTSPSGTGVRVAPLPVAKKSAPPPTRVVAAPVAPRVKNEPSELRETKRPLPLEQPSSAARPAAPSSGGIVTRNPYQ